MAKKLQIFWLFSTRFNMTSIECYVAEIYGPVFEKSFNLVFVFQLTRI